MRRFGKIAVLFLVFTIMSAILSTSRLSYATDAVAVSVTSASGNPGENVTVSVNLGNVPSAGLTGGLFVLEYDLSKLDFVSFTAGDIVVDKTRDVSMEVLSQGFQPGLVILYMDNTQDGNSQIKNNGVLCNIVFSIKSSCPNGQVELKLNNQDIRISGANVAVPFYSNYMDAVQATFTSSSITVPRSGAATATPTSTPTGGATAQTTAGTTPNGTPGATNAGGGNNTPVPSIIKTPAVRLQLDIKLKLEDPNITVNGESQPLNPKNSKITPVFGDSGAILPAAEIADVLGAVCEWDAVQKKIKIICKNRKTEMWIGKPVVSMDGKTKDLGEYPEMIDNKPYIPLCIASVSLGCIVEWDKSNDTISIKLY